MTITEEHKRLLYKYMWGIMNNRHCKLIRMNGIPNHVHILVDVHPSVTISGLVSELKRASTLWVKQTGLFPNFDGWGREYCAFSKNHSDLETVKNYIIRQEEHHKVVSYEDEMSSMLMNVGLEWRAEYYD
jgi:REP element-mobilizing transposase RayT